jgi:hypothetical protein
LDSPGLDAVACDRNGIAKIAWRGDSILDTKLFAILARHWLCPLTHELSGRCRVPHDSATARRSGPLERIVRR